MELCSKTLSDHKFTLDVLESGDVIEKCVECYKVFYHFAKNIKTITLDKNTEK